MRNCPDEGRFVGISHEGPTWSGWSGGLAASSNPEIDMLVYGTEAGEVAVTSDILRAPELEEGEFEYRRVGELIVCQARLQTEIPYSLGQLTVGFTTTPLFAERP